MREKGLTLIEVLISLVIVTAIMLSLFMAFNSALAGWRKSNNLLEAAAVGRSVLERMSREMESLIVTEPSASFYCVGYDSSAPSGFRANSCGDEFYFIAPLNPGDSFTDLCEVGYWCGDEGTLNKADDRLNRFYVTADTGLFDFNFSTGTSSELSPNVTDLQFRYYPVSGATGQDTWDSRVAGGPPSRITISVTVQAGKGSALTNPAFVETKFSTDVFIP